MFVFPSRALLLKLLKQRLKPFLGDKSVTMCGVAQEVTQEGDRQAYTKPWHVTVTAGRVRALHLFHRSLKSRFFFFFFYNTSIPAVCVLFRIHREPELGADSCPLFYTSEYRQNLPAVANNTWSVTAQGRKRRALVPVAFRFLSFVGAGTAVSKAVIVHPKYNIRALKHRNVSEFYDYDVALIQVDTSIPLSWKARSEG